MAKGKGKGGSSGGPHKKHGPKTNRFHFYNKCLRVEMSKLGVLNKYSDKEAFEQALSARGIKGDLNLFWKDFCYNWSASKEKQKEYFKQLPKKA